MTRGKDESELVQRWRQDALAAEDRIRELEWQIEELRAALVRIEREATGHIRGIASDALKGEK